MSSTLSWLKWYPCFLHHFWYLAANAFSDSPQTHSQCQKAATKSTHFLLPSAPAGQENRRFASGKVVSSKELSLFSEHGLYLGTLLVLPVCGFQHQPYIVFRDVLGQSQPVVGAIVSQLDRILLAGLGPPQAVVSVKPNIFVSFRNRNGNILQSVLQ